MRHLQSVRGGPWRLGYALVGALSVRSVGSRIVTLTRSREVICDGLMAWLKTLFVENRRGLGLLLALVLAKFARSLTRSSFFIFIQFSTY